jgi:hypothetical protein
MEMSGQLHHLITMPLRKSPFIPVGYEKETAKQQIWTQWLQEKYIPVGN